MSPDYCEVDYTYDLGSILNGNNQVDTAITRVGDTFSFFYDKDLAPATQNQNQRVRITATSKSIYQVNNPRYTITGSFITTFRSPCNDPNYSSITTNAFTDPVDMTDSYTGSTIQFRYLPAYTISPSICLAEIRCINLVESPNYPNPLVLPNKVLCQPFINNKIQWNFYSSDHQN